ncbi:MAG TPA: hypothetical protein VGA70_07250 [Longimicrobiales bacterium]|jgi:hypothetical protein
MLNGGGIILVGLLITLLVPNPSKPQWFALRLFLAVGALALGAGLPGLLIEVESAGVRPAHRPSPPSRYTYSVPASTRTGSRDR